MSLSENWMDYRACKWPYPLSNNDPRGGGAQGSECSWQPRRESDSVLAERHSVLCLGQNCRCTQLDAATSTASPQASIITPRSPVRAGRDGRRTIPEPNGANQTAAEPQCYAGSAQKPTILACSLISSGTRRRTTDALGMPLSLAEYFALENERRGCFGQEVFTVSVQLPHPPPEERSIALDPPFSASRDTPRDYAGQPHETQTRHLQSDQNSQEAGAGMHLASVPEQNAPVDCKENPVVITFSHFLPRAEIATIYPLTPRALAYVMGSSRIDEQLRQAGASLHVFGHSHVNLDKKIEVRGSRCGIHGPANGWLWPGRIATRNLCRRPKCGAEVTACLLPHRV